MNDSKGLKKWLVVRSLSAFLLAFVFSLSLVMASPSLTVCAASEEDDYKAYVEEIRSTYSDTATLDQCDYYAVGSDGSIIFSIYPLYYGQYTWSNGTITDVMYKSKAIYYDPNSTSASCWGSSNGSDSYLYFSHFGLFLTEKIVYSNHDILDYSTGDVFFHPAPVLEKMVLLMTPEKVLGQILGLLPLLIPCLAGLVGFSKGWRFLSNLLHKA